MDERERFDIRRKVLAENGMDFEEYISKQQAEIDLLNKRIDELEKDCSTLISVKNKQQAEIDRLIETIETGDCWISSFISSVCDKGTKGCIANHKHKGE